nr:unnamed protein product [uncultured bacterium]
MRKKNEHYSEEFKLQVLRDYYASGMSKCACVRKYGLSCNALLLSWLSKYESENDLLPLQENQTEEDMANRDKESYKEEVQELKKRIRALEKALEYSKLETLARDIMIDKAEQLFEISIRKKSGAK